MQIRRNNSQPVLQPSRNSLADSVRKSYLLDQNQELKQLIKTRFHKDYARNRPQVIQYINAEVDSFFKSQKVSEDSLRALKRKIAESCQSKPEVLRKVEEVKPSQSAVTLPPIEEQQVAKPQPQPAETRAEGRLRAEQDSEDEGQRPHWRGRDPGLGDDEWAVLVKLDTELYHKEKELQKLKKKEYMSRIRSELDRQIELKQKRIQSEDKTSFEYTKLERRQMEDYDRQERQKQDEVQKKYEVEKEMRDKQVKMEHRRKRMERRREKELDTMMVHKNEEEIEAAARILQNKKDLERTRLREMMNENELIRRRLTEDQQKEREDEINQQREYDRMVQNIEDRKENDRRERELRIKNILSKADLIVSKQKDEEHEEDQRLRKYFEENMRRDHEKEEHRKDWMRRSKEDIRTYLDKQIAEKKDRELRERKEDLEQATIWKSDYEKFQEHESRRLEFMRSSNLKHQQILLQQIAESGQHKKARTNLDEVMERMYEKLVLRDPTHSQDPFALSRAH